MSGKRVCFQINFWALIGPLICLITFFVLYIKNTVTPITFPLALLIGVPICWKWKLKGFAGAALFIFFALTYHYSDLPLEERFWHLGIGLSILLSLLIAALSFEEVEALIEAIKLESRSRLENLWKLDEKLQQAGDELKKKKERIREGNMKLASYQKLLDRSTEEIVELRDTNQKINCELQQALKDLEQLQHQLAVIQNPSSPGEDLYRLRMEAAEKARLFEEAKRELEETQSQLLNMQKEFEEMKTYQLSDVEEALQRHLLGMEKEREDRDAEYQQEIETMQEMISNLLKSIPK